MDAITKSVLVADRLRAADKPATSDNIRRELRALAEELRTAQPPDPWAAGIAALRAKENRS
jgi:hypothetical protein